MSAPAGPLPVSLDEWLSAAGADMDEYAQAACTVSRWLARYDGSQEAMIALVDGLRSGATFADLVGQVDG
jgi:hypothetical protein